MHPSAAIETELLVVPILMADVTVKAVVMAVPILMAAVTVKASVTVKAVVMDVPILMAAVMVVVKDVVMVLKKVLMMAMDWREAIIQHHRHKHNMLYWRCDLHSHNQSHNQHIYQHHHHHRTCKVKKNQLKLLDKQIHKDHLMVKNKNKMYVPSASKLFTTRVMPTRHIHTPTLAELIMAAALTLDTTIHTQNPTS